MNIRAVLIDLSGTLHVGDLPTPNAVKALRKLRGLGLQVRFVTNTTKESRKSLYERLSERIGFQIEELEIYSSLSVAVEYVEHKNLNPFYLVSDDARRDFPASVLSSPFDSVVVGLAPDKFDYETLTNAFNVLRQSRILIAIHQGRYYNRGDGLALGPGFFTKGLEYSCGVTATVVGKPNKYFFEAAIPVGLSPEDCIMIGDDVRDDIQGAMKIGMKAVLVRTGKFQAGDDLMLPLPTSVQDNFSDAVDWIEANLQNITDE